MMRKQQHACFFGDLTEDIVGKMTGALVTKLCNLAGALTFKISVLTGSNYSIKIIYRSRFLNSLIVTLYLWSL